MATPPCSINSRDYRQVSTRSRASSLPRANPTLMAAAENSRSELLSGQKLAGKQEPTRSKEEKKRFQAGRPEKCGTCFPSETPYWIVPGIKALTPEKDVRAFFFQKIMQFPGSGWGFR